MGFDGSGEGFNFGEIRRGAVPLHHPPKKTPFVMKEVIIYVTDSLGVAHPETIERASIFFLSLVFRVIQKPRI